MRKTLRVWGLASKCPWGDAQIDRDRVTDSNAHATSTPPGEGAEVEVMANVWRHNIDQIQNNSSLFLTAMNWPTGTDSSRLISRDSSCHKVHQSIRTLVHWKAHTTSAMMHRATNTQSKKRSLSLEERCLRLPDAAC